MFPSPGFPRVHGVRDDSILHVGGHGGWRGGGGRCRAHQFGIAIALAVTTTVVAQWRLGWFPWWAIQVVGLTALLAVASAPVPLQRAGATSAPQRKRVPAGVRQNRDSGTGKQLARSSSATKQSGSKTAKTRAPAQAQSSSAAIRAMEKAAKKEKAGSKAVGGHKEVTEHQGDS